MSKSFFNFREKAGLVEQVGLEEAKFTDKQIKMAYGVANDRRYKGGDMTGAVKAIEKIAKGLSKHPSIQKVLRVTNEDVEVNEEFNIDEAIAEALAESIMLEDMMNEEWDETQMALGQLRFIEYACDEIAEYLEDDVEDMPEWFQNKLTMAFAQIQALHSYAEGDRYDDDEDEDEDEMEESVMPVDQDKLAKIRAMLAKEKK
jgi:hypothetical protein